MARGYDKNRQRKDALGKLGGPLSRRSRSRCELCDARGVKLKPTEVPPLPEEPEAELAVLLCERCHDGVEGRPVNEGEWRFLEGVVWSEVPPIQVTAIRMLRRLVDDGARWGAPILESLYLAPEVEAWLES